jgi:hypothetical protein
VIDGLEYAQHGRIQQCGAQLDRRRALSLRLSAARELYVLSLRL